MNSVESYCIILSSWINWSLKRPVFPKIITWHQHIWWTGQGKGEKWKAYQLWKENNFVSWHLLVCACSVAWSCPTLCDPMDHSPPGSSVHGILQSRILQCVAMTSPGGSSQPRGQTCISCVDRQILYHWSTWEAPFTRIILEITSMTKAKLKT